MNKKLQKHTHTHTQTQTQTQTHIYGLILLQNILSNKPVRWRQQFVMKSIAFILYTIYT